MTAAFFSALFEPAASFCFHTPFQPEDVRRSATTHVVPPWVVTLASA